MASPADAESVLVYINTAPGLRADARLRDVLPLAIATIADVARAGVLPTCVSGAAPTERRGGDAQKKKKMHAGARCSLPPCVVRGRTRTRCG